MSGHQSELDARSGTAQDIVWLLRLFNQLNPASKSDALADMARRLAKQRIGGRKGEDGEALDPDDWLEELGQDVYPIANEVERLVAAAAGAQYDARRTILNNCALTPFLSASEDVSSIAEEIYGGYMYVRISVREWADLPSPADHFGIVVDTSDFEMVDDDASGAEPQFDAAAWEAAVRTRCIEEFSQLVWLWRQAFFEAVLSGQQPEARQRR